MKDGQPHHGVISYLGGQWSVVYDCSKSSYVNQTLTGYGDFPFDRYNIPVIDFTCDDRVFAWLNLNNHNKTPKDQLQDARILNLNILNS